jgi:hypothetical protein
VPRLVSVTRSKQVIELVVEALLAIYSTWGGEVTLTDIRKPYRASTCLVRYSWSVPAEVYGPANGNRNAAYSQQFRE